MNKSKTIKILLIATLILTLNACGKKTEEGREIIKEPGSTITIIEDDGKEPAEPVVSVEKIEQVENGEISDWLDDETAVVSKENDTLDKMSLLELSEHYPRSLYLYNINTKEYELLKEREDVFLGEAALSADKKYLLYSEYTLGDPIYYVMDLETREALGILGDNVGGALSARWSGNEVFGAAYYNGAYTATVTGEISVIEDLNEEGLFIVRKIQDNIYYNTNYDETLFRFNTVTKEKTNLNLERVYDVIPAPDGNKMLVLQRNETKNTLILCDTDGGNQKIIAEGTELGGVSWSPDQRMVAYHRKGTDNNTTVNGLYIYDMLTAESSQIAVNIQNATTSWSPSSEKLAYAEWNGEQYNSSIVYLKYSLQ